MIRIMLRRLAKHRTIQDLGEKAYKGELAIRQCDASTGAGVLCLFETIKLEASRWDAVQGKLADEPHFKMDRFEPKPQSVRTKRRTGWCAGS